MNEVLELRDQLELIRAVGEVMKGLIVVAVIEVLLIIKSYYYAKSRI
jgi:hypothetical protein